MIEFIKLFNQLRIILARSLISSTCHEEKKVAWAYSISRLESLKSIAEDENLLRHTGLGDRDSASFGVHLCFVRIGLRID